MQKTYPWESCITLTDSWGWAPGQHFKSARKIIGILAEISAKGGCLALGVGPTPQGLIEEEAVCILCQIGDWLGRCGEAVYSTRITENYNDGDIWFSSSKDGKTLYAIYALKDGESLPDTLKWSGNLPKGGKVTILNNGRKVRAAIKDGRVCIKLPKGMRQEPVAIKFEI